MGTLVAGGPNQPAELCFHLVDIINHNLIIRKKGLILGLILGLMLRMLVRKIPENNLFEKNQAERSAYSEPRGPKTLNFNF